MRRFSIKTTGLVLLSLWTFLVMPTNIQAASPSLEQPTLDQLIEEGMAHNKEIESLEDRVESLKEKIPFAGSLDDPRLGFAILNLPTDTFSLEQEAMTQKQIFIAQKIPWFGKLSLRSQRTALKAIRQQAILEAKRLELTREIATAYYQLGFVAESLEINERLTNTIDQLIAVAETRYATGRGLQQDVLQAQVELSKLLDEKIVLESRYRTLQDQINALLSRKNFEPVPPIKGLIYSDLQLEIEDLQSRALKENPQLRVRQAETDIAALEIELARKDYWPDMDIKLAYGQRDEDFNGRDLPDLVTGSVVMNIPLWQKNRQDPKLAASKKDHQAAIKFYQNLVESLPFKVDALATEIRNNQKNYRLFTDALLFQAEQWASSSLSAYEVGSVEFSTMINAQIRLLRFELQAENYLFNIYQKRAALEEVIGGPF